MTRPTPHLGAALLLVLPLALACDGGDGMSGASDTDMAGDDGGDSGGGGSSEYFIELSGEMPGGPFDFECDLENDPKPSSDPENWWKAGNPDFQTTENYIGGLNFLTFRCCEDTPGATDAAGQRCLRAQIVTEDLNGAHSNDESICTMAAGGFFWLGTTSTPGLCDRGWTVHSETLEVSSLDFAESTASGTFSGSYTDDEGAMWTLEGSFNGKASDLLNP